MDNKETYSLYFLGKFMYNPGGLELNWHNVRVFIKNSILITFFTEGLSIALRRGIDGVFTAAKWLNYLRPNRLLNSP